jgi:tetratricopeptide (TPR) repeat protein
VGAVLFERFEVRATLGAGGFGRVFRCYDRVSQGELAVKELHRFGADALLSFKNEFRALADVHHPNLARLYELFERDGQWAFSLEYVPGTDLLSWVRPEGVLDEARLRAALVGLCHGLSALHSIGLAHRDVKPANVRVTPEGRVVLLDFGVVAPLSRGADGSGSGGLGTAAYMAPEQARDEGVGTPADFYAVGTLLYEALCGELPFDGPALDVLVRKQGALPVHPTKRAAGAPADLAELSMALLSPWPEQRPDAARVLEVLAHAAPRPGRALTSLPAPDEPFVGRRAELVGLHASCARALGEGLELVLIEGESGAGKSALMQQFLDEVAVRLPEALVLRGRCHVAEQVPYKAFDAVVDELAGALRTLTLGHCRTLLPDDAHLLPLLFPVLGLVPAIARSSGNGEPPRLERYPLFRAFLELLANVAGERPLLIAIDDLQWCDLESLALLESLLVSPAAPRILLAATLRPLEGDEPQTRRLAALRDHTRVSRLALGALSSDDARAVAARLLGPTDDAGALERIVAGAHGQPFLLVELARHREGRSAGDVGEALRARFAGLAPEARKVLEVTCVAGSPLGRPTLARALAIPPAAVDDALAQLRIGRLLRPLHDGRLVSYHDRIRDSLLAALPPAEVRALHGQLARACEAATELDAARIAYHHLESDEPWRAAPWLVQAAREAAGLAAFERAAELYAQRLALPGAPLSGDERLALELARAEALASAGRASAAARVLLDGLPHASGEARTERLVLAAQRLLQAGDIDAGLGTARSAFAAAGMHWPDSRPATVVALLYGRARLKLSSLGKPEHARPASSHARLRVGARLWQPLLWADWLRGAELIERHLRHALDHGDSRGVSLALQAHAVLVAMQGSADRAHAAFEASAAWAQGDVSHERFALQDTALGMCQIAAGELRAAEQSLEAAEQRLREHCPGESWQLVNARGLLLQVWRWRGRYRDLVEAYERWLEEARVRGDRFADTTYTVTGYGCYRELMDDQPARAEAAVQRAMEHFSGRGFGMQHLAAVRARFLIAAYTDIEAPAALWRETWPRIRGSLLLRLPVPRELITFYRVQAELGSAVARPAQRKAHLTRALSLLGRSTQSRSGSALATYARAEVALLQGEREEALRLATDARERLEAMGHVWSKYPALVAAAATSPAAFSAEDARVLEFHAAQGFRNAPRAISLALPLYAWMRETHLGLPADTPAPRSG